MRFGLLRLVILFSLVSLLGCMKGGGAKVQWSENIAVYASSHDTKLHDDNIHSEGETARLISDAQDEASQLEADKYNQATLEWGKSQPIQRVIIKADPGQLEFFEIQYLDEEGKWHTIKDVQNHVKDVYKLDLGEPVYTRKLRLKVPNKWDSRSMTGAKRRTRGEGGSEVVVFKKIREIEVYYALKPGETPQTQ